MKEREIIEGNKLIAEFMGGQAGCYSLDRCWWDNLTRDELMKWENHLRFEYKWDWLMPVVEKIESDTSKVTGVRTYRIIIENNGCLIYSHKYDNGTITATSKIEATWQAIVDFIKWYNKNKAA